jgi:hypothetical protein
MGKEWVGRAANVGREEICNQDLGGKTYSKYATRKTWMYMGGHYENGP